MELLQAVQQPQRQRLLRLVWETERSAGELHRALGSISFGAVSQHLRVLREAGAVRQRRDGRRRLYRAERQALGALGEWLESMWAGQLENLRELAEAEESLHAPHRERDPR